MTPNEEVLFVLSTVVPLMTTVWVNLLLARRR